MVARQRAANQPLRCVRGLVWPCGSGAWWRGCVMAALLPDEEAMLVLLSIGPLSRVPKLHRGTVQRLASMGLAARMGSIWYPTRRGLAEIGCRLH